MSLQISDMEKQVEECKTCKDKKDCPTSEGFPYCTKKHDSVYQLHSPMKFWYGICGETLEEVKCFGNTMSTNFNNVFLEFCESPRQAFKAYWERKCKTLKKELEKAETLANLYEI